MADTSLIHVDAGDDAAHDAAPHLAALTTAARRGAEQLVAACHTLAARAGWWQAEGQRPAADMLVPARLMLAVCALGGLMEQHRRGRLGMTRADLAAFAGENVRNILDPLDADPLDAMTAAQLGPLVRLMLTVSELAEAAEAHVTGARDEHLPHRPGRAVEWADAVIRLCDTAGAYDLDLPGAIADKLAFNARRADHKPEARAAAGGKAY